jgi:predicted nucleic acid-binding protein
VPLGTEVAKVGGVLARRYRPSYGGIEDVDYLIAATALLLDADLLTTNVKHFPMLEGLQPAY